MSLIKKINRVISKINNYSYYLNCLYVCFLLLLLFCLVPIDKKTGEQLYQTPPENQAQELGGLNSCEWLFFFLFRISLALSLYPLHIVRPTRTHSHVYTPLCHCVLGCVFCYGFYSKLLYSLLTTYYIAHRLRPRTSPLHTYYIVVREPHPPPHTHTLSVPSFSL